MRRRGTTHGHQGHTGINRLTVIGKEEFNKIAAALQKEYEQEGLQFGLVTKEKLGAIPNPRQVAA